ncbi:MAG TPA: acyl-CoA dehydrogenase family protein [Xanthobacteraceae bacterium]|nr:acyl-CoA dehydrogenase family protein [Xanthobacteraceae bacterium]
MDFELPEDIRLLRETVRKYVDRELIPIEMHSMEGPELKPEIKTMLEAKARALGLWQLDTPAEFGGQGLSLLALAVVWEEISRSIALPNRGDGVFGPSPRPILLRLPEKMKERYLHPLLRGEKSAAFAQTEPDAGSDPGRLRTRAIRQGDHYVINGYKRFISHAKGADFLQLVAATDPEKGSRGGLSVFIVDMDTSGLSIVRETRHMMGDVTYEIALDDVKVPAENLVGKEGDGMREAQSWISRNRVHQASHGLGVAQRCLEMIGTYAQQRVTFGEPLARRQAVQFAVAELYTKYQTGQMLTHRTAWKVDKGIASRHDAYMAKIHCTELGFEAADRCMQFHGASGLSTELPIEAMWRRSRSYLITGGPAEIMRATLAREVFKIYQ